MANRFRPMLLFSREHALKLGDGRVGGIGRNPAHGRSHRDFFGALAACDLVRVFPWVQLDAVTDCSEPRGVVFLNEPKELLMLSVFLLDFSHGSGSVAPDCL